MLPCLDLFLLGFGDLRWVSDGRHRYGPLEEGPAASGLHCLSEPHDEYRPVGTIRFEVRDVGGKLLNGSWKGGGSRGGHFQVIQGAEFVVLDVGRAHNLWQTRDVGT